MLAVCDPKYKFDFVDRGEYGKQSGDRIFMGSMFYHCLENTRLELPKRAIPLQPDIISLLRVLLGNDVYP